MFKIKSLIRGKSKIKVEKHSTPQAQATNTEAVHKYNYFSIINNKKENNCEAKLKAEFHAKVA